MTDPQRISAFSPITEADATDSLVIVDVPNVPGGTKKIAASNLNPNLEITAAEITAGVTPTNLLLEPGNVKRYGAIGDGIADDTVAIANAALSSPIVFIPAGTYLIGVIFYTSNITFQGEGIGITILKLKDSQDTPVFSRADAILADDFPTINLLAQIDNVEIKDLTVDGNQANQTTPISTDHDYTILLQRVIVARVSNVEVKNGRVGGITLWQCRSGIVENCIVDDCVQTGSVQNQIESFRDFNAGTAADFEGGKHIFRNNVVSGTIGFGVAVHRTYMDLIDGNVVKDCLNAYGAESAFMARIVNNTSWGKGIDCSDPSVLTPIGLVISNNTIREPAQNITAAGVRAPGIKVVDHVGTIISNNSISEAKAEGSGPTWGTIILSSCDNSTITGNIIKDPVDGGQDVSGIIMFSSPNCKIVGNHIESFEHFGVQLNGSNDCKVVGNTCIQTGVSALSNGVHLITTSNCIIDDNSIDNYVNGVRSGGSSVGNVAVNNKFPNTTTPLIEVTQGGILRGLIGTQRIYSATASPTAGTWAVGDHTRNENSSVAEEEGWDCVTAGTPGTWNNVGPAAEIVTTTNVIISEENGTTFYLNSAGGFTSTLPAPVNGLKFKFIVKTAPTTAYIITTNAGANILFGTVNEITTTVGVTIQAQDTLNFVASVAIIGDWVEFESDDTNWYVRGAVQVDNAVTVSVT